MTRGHRNLRKMLEKKDTSLRSWRTLRDTHREVSSRGGLTLNNTFPYCVTGPLHATTGSWHQKISSVSSPALEKSIGCARWVFRFLLQLRCKHGQSRSRWCVRLCPYPWQQQNTCVRVRTAVRMSRPVCTALSRLVIFLILLILVCPQSISSIVLYDLSTISITRTSSDIWRLTYYSLLSVSPWHWFFL